MRIHRQENNAANGYRWRVFMDDHLYFADYFTLANMRFNNQYSPWPVFIFHKICKENRQAYD